MNIDEVAVAGNIIREGSHIHEILLGQHVIAHNPPRLADTDLLAGGHQMGLFESGHISPEEFQLAVD